MNITSFFINTLPFRVSTSVRSAGRYLAVGGLIAALSACGASSNWVQVTAEGAPVRLATTAEVANCTRVGSANVNAVDNIAFVQRGANRLQEELVRLARNEGGRLGGNRVVPESVIDDGRQSFGVFRC
ncbi:MAG: DUF4156 domain-containing protein [Pseudohongiella sp.]|nr:DUF4156 domain-containing protein [Pseudohongiella sp.]MDO9519220.1 DUF4156 domain-containing protein [Pseudohongiella sp.]MDP2128331.1 DUF4156 domain-containing protein [Pseudohongiella sp.]